MEKLEMSENSDILNKVIAIDTETTGPDLFKNNLLFLAFVPFDKSIKPFECGVKWPNKLEWGGRGQEFFEKYKSMYEKSAMPIKHFCYEVNSYIERNFKSQVTLVGHNVAFDYYFLKKTFNEAQISFPEKISHRTVDTHSLLFERIAMGLLESEYNSSDAAFGLLVNQDDNRHTALKDAQLALGLFKKLLNQKFK